MFENNQLTLPEVRPAAVRKRRILVVDDMTLNLAVVSAMLKRIGHDDITHVCDGVEALALLKTNPDRYDLVMTDLQMPKMNGDELLRKIREDDRLAGLPVHLITADIHAPTTFAGVGFDSILLKPVSMASLSKLLNEGV